MRQGVLEGVRTLGEEPRLVQQLGRLQERQLAVQDVLGLLGNDLQQGPGDLGADDRRRLEEALLLRRQAIDPGGQHRLDRGGHRQSVEGGAELVGPWFPDQHARLDQGADTLFQEERIPFGARNQQGVSGVRLASSPSRACNNASALTAGSGSSRSCV